MSSLPYQPNPTIYKEKPQNVFYPNEDFDGNSSVPAKFSSTLGTWTSNLYIILLILPFWFFILLFLFLLRF
jgi:hypothetical protein